MLRNQKGFTLLELIVVILILGILAAAVAPSVGRIVGGVGIKSEALEFAEAVRYTQSRALSEGQYFYLKLNRNTGYYKVYALLEDESGNIYEDIRKEDTVDDVVAGITSSFPPDPDDGSWTVITYMPTGATSQTGAGTITFRSENGDTVKVIVALGTGRVRVEK